jgi:hypothetical protein
MRSAAMAADRDSYTTDWNKFGNNQESDWARNVRRLLIDFIDDHLDAKYWPAFTEWRCVKLCVYEFRGHHKAPILLVEYDEDPPIKVIRVEIRR